MNQKLKYVGLLAILPLFTVALSSVYLSDAEAVGGLGLEEAKEKLKVSEPAPTVELSLVQIGEPQATRDVPPPTSDERYRDNYDNTLTFRTIYVVQNEGDEAVKNIEILVTSDTETVQANLQGNLDQVHKVIAAKIKATDPDTISAKITGYQIA